MNCVRMGEIDPGNPGSKRVRTSWRQRTGRVPQLTGPHALLALSIVTAVVSQMLFRAGVGSIGKLTLTREALPSELLKIITSPAVMVGLLLYSLGFLAWLSAMSRLGLSYVYPFTSVNYVLVLLMSWLIFNEPLSLLRWLGVAVIIFGVFLASRA